MLALAVAVKAAALGAAAANGGAMPVSPVLCAVLIGLAWRNLIGVPVRCEAGLQWAMHGLLRAGIALVGLRLTVTGVTAVAATAAPVVVVCIVTALLAGAVASSALGLPKRLGQLLAVGTAICGCTAVVALSPVIKARHHETAFAVACVVLFGCVAMLLHPWLAHWLFGSSALHAGVFLGTAIHDTSQVVGAALIYAQQYDAPEALAAAGATKLMRNLAIALLVPAAVWLMRREEGVWGSDNAGKAAMPAFVLVFVSMIAVRTMGDTFIAPSTLHGAWASVLELGHGASDILLMCGMTAVGLSVSFGQLRRVGWRPLAAGASVAAAVTIVSIALTFVSLRWHGPIAAPPTLESPLKE